MPIRSPLSSLRKVPIRITREQVVLALLMISVVVSLGVVLADALLFLRYYRIAIEPAVALPQSRIEVQKDDFEKAVTLIRARLKE